jgi:hypothetical protein
MCMHTHRGLYLHLGSAHTAYVCMHIAECHKLCTFTSTCTCIHTRLCVHVRVCLHLVRAHTVYAYTPRTRLSDARRFRIQGLGLFFFKVPLN